jgi:2-oxoacid:acceptor oxidoreductase gamma subunit (pyruvate/2-ketoisovalerate family)
MERELLLTGIGGQGIQLAAQVIARAALADGRSVQMFGSYGGMMRGGRTDATIVVADAPVEAPPTVGDAWSAMVMHDAYATAILEAVRPGGLILLNAEVGAPALDRDRYSVVAIAATEIADGVGNRMAASMVMTGAYAAATGLVSLGSLCGAVAESLPPYRQKLAEVNVAALRAGFDAGPRSVAPAWEPQREPAR